MGINTSLNDEIPQDKNADDFTFPRKDLTESLIADGLFISGFPVKEGEFFVRTYAAGELAIYYINRNELPKAKTILVPAVNNTLLNKGRLNRSFGFTGSSSTTDATDGDCSVMSIAFGKYLAATVGDTDSFRNDCEKANLLIQAWLNGVQTVTFPGGSSVTLPTYLDSPPGDSPFRFMSDQNFGATRWTELISVENETRRAISLWHANEKDKAIELVNALVTAAWDNGRKQFYSGIDKDTLDGTGKDCARDAYSLLVLAAHGMGILDLHLDQLNTAANTIPCYTEKPDPVLAEHIVFGYVGEGAIPEYMFLDAEAMRALGQKGLYKQTFLAAEALQLFLGGKYSTTSTKKTPINLITRDFSLDPDRMNHYF